MLSSSRDQITRQAAVRMEVSDKHLRRRWWQLSHRERHRLRRSLEQALAGSPREQLRIYLLVRDLLLTAKRDSMDTRYRLTKYDKTPRPAATLAGATAGGN